MNNKSEIIFDEEGGILPDVRKIEIKHQEDICIFIADILEKALDNISKEVLCGSSKYMEDLIKKFPYDPKVCLMLPVSTAVMDFYFSVNVKVKNYKGRFKWDHEGIHWEGQDETEDFTTIGEIINETILSIKKLGKIYWCRCPKIQH